MLRLILELKGLMFSFKYGDIINYLIKQPNMLKSIIHIYNQF